MQDELRQQQQHASQAVRPPVEALAAPAAADPSGAARIQFDPGNSVANTPLDEERSLLPLLSAALGKALARCGGPANGYFPRLLLVPLILSVLGLAWQAGHQVANSVQPAEALIASLAAALLGLPALYYGFAWIRQGAVVQRRLVAGLCRNRGLVQQLATGDLPVAGLRESCPVFLQPLLHRPALPRELRLPAARQCWMLIWNADWFCGLKHAPVRERWHSYWLFPPILVLSILAILYPESLAAGLGGPIVSILLGFGLLRSGSMQLAAAWGIHDCLAELAEMEGIDGN